MAAGHVAGLSAEPTRRQCWQPPAPPAWSVHAGRWWVLHTRSRAEKRVAEELDKHGITFYLPLVSIRRTYAKCNLTYHLPLFPGYVFLAGGAEECDRARRTQHIANILPVIDQTQLRAELLQIYRVIASGAGVELLTGIPPGSRCRVRSGPLQGIEGIVVCQGRRYRLHVAVTMLGQSAVLELDAALLEAVA